MKNKIFIVIVLFISLFTVVSVANDLDEYLDGVLYIKLKEDTNLPKSQGRKCQVRELLQNERSVMIENYAIKEYALNMHFLDNDYLINVYRIEFDSIQLTDKLIEELRNDTRIEFVERIPIHTIPVVEQEDPIKTFLIDNTITDKQDYRVLAYPNDFFWGMQDNIHTSWFWDVIGFEEIFDKYSGNPDIKVAIVDNAIWEDHEDLSFEYDNLFDTFLGVEGSAAPPKTASSDPYSWSHGTHCAGLIGAVTNNNIGIASLSSGVSLMGVKAAGPSALDLARSLQGIMWAAENGAKVINLSFGSEIYSQVEQEIIKSCIDNGIIIIAAAGNNAKNMDFFPAQYDGVISVASVNYDLKKSDFSNYGQWVDIAAPGGYYVKESGEIDALSQIFSTTYCKNQTLADKELFSDKYYDQMAGTSMAAPVASALVSLIVSSYPDLNAYQMKEILQRSATQVSQTDLYINPNSGVINAPAAMALMESNQNKYVRNLKAVSQTNEEILVSWLEPEDNTGIIGYSIYEDEELIVEQTEQLSFSLPIDSDSSVGFYGVKALYQEEDGLIAYTKATTNPNSIDEAIYKNEKPGYYIVSNQTLVLTGVSDIQQVSIYDIQGRLLINSKSKSNSINISSLTAGVYIVKLKSRGGTQSVKILL